MGVINLYKGDPRIGELAADIERVIRERTPLPFPSVLGALEIVKLTLFKEQYDEYIRDNQGR
jgi:hypothetical protein